MNVRLRASYIDNSSGGRKEQRQRKLPGLVTERLASENLDQAKSRVRRVRKAKSVLALGKLTGQKGTKNIRRRSRSYLNKSRHPLNQRHRESWEICGQFLPNGSLPSLTSTDTSDPTGNPSMSGPPMFAAKRKRLYENLFGEDTHKNGYALSNGPGPASEKLPELTGLLTSAMSTGRPLPVPGGEWSISRGVRDDEENPRYRYDEIQARRVRTKNQLLPDRDRESFAFAHGSFSPISLGSQYQISPERLKGVVNTEEIIQRGVNETARPGVLVLRQPDPALVEAQVRTTPERGRRGVNTSEANCSFPSSTTPKDTTDGGGAEGASLEQNLAKLLARLQNNKDFDALISGNVKASSIPQSTTCLSSVASQTTNSRETNKKDDFVVQADKVRKNLHERSNFATPSPDEESVGNTSMAPPAPEAGVVPVDHGEEALSVNLPRISFQEQDALRLLYRRWWMRLAKGDSISCLPTPTIGRDKQAELANENGDEKEKANLGSKALARVKLRKTSTLDSSTARDDVTIATEIELPGSFGDLTTTLSTNPSVPVTETYGAADDACHTSYGGTRERMFRPDSTTGLARDKLSESRGNPLSQTLNTSRRGTEAQQMEPRHSKHVTIVSARKDGAVATEIQLPWNLSLTPSVFRGEQLTSAVPATDKSSINSIGATSTGKSDAVHSPQGRVKATTFMTLLTPPSSTYGAVDAAGGISQGQTRVGAFHLGSAARLAREELPGYTGNEANQISSFVTQGKGKKQVGPQCSQDASEAPIRKEIAVATEIQLPWSLFDVSAIPTAFHGVHLQSVEAANQKRSSRANATGGPDATQRPRGGDGDTQVRTSANPLDTPAGTYDTTGNACYTSRHQTKVIDFRPGTAASLAENEYSESTYNHFDQALNARRLTEIKQAESGYSRNVTTMPTRMDVAVATEVQLPWYIFPNSSVCRGVQLTSAIAAKDERSGISFGATRKSDAVQFEGGDVETKAATSVTLLTSLASICGAGDDTGNNQSRMRVRAIHPHSIASLMQGESPDYTCDRPNQVSNEVRRAKEEEQAWPRHSQSATRASTQKGRAIVTQRQLPSNLVEVSLIPSASLGVTPSSAKATVEICRSEVIATGSSCADQRFRGGDRDTEDANSTAPLVPRTGTYVTIDNFDHTCQGRTRQSDFCLGSVVASARYEFSGSVSNPPSQALSNAKGGEEERQVEPRDSQDAKAVLRRNNGAVMSKVNIPWHIFGISAIPSTSRRVQLTSEGVRTDGVSATRSSGAIRRPQITDGSADDAISTTSSSLASATCGTRDDAGRISHGEMRAKTSPSDSAVGLAQDEPSRYTGNQPVSARAGTGEIQTSGSKSEEDSDAIQRLKAGGIDTKAFTSVIRIALPTATCGAMDDVGHINHCQTRVSSYPSGSQTCLTPNKPSGWTGNQPDQTLRNTRRGTEDEQAGPRCSQNATTVPTLGGCAVTIEKQFTSNLPDGLDILSSSQGVQLISVGEGTDEGCRYDEKVVKGLDSTRRQDTGEIPEAATFSAFLSAHSGTYGTAGDAGYINHGQRSIGAFYPVSKASLVQDESSENQGNQVYQIPRDTRRGEKEGQAEPQCSQDATTFTTQRGGRFATENQPPRDYFDVSVILSPARRVKLTSIEVRPDEGRRSITGATRSSSNTGQYSQGTDGDTKVVRNVPPISQPTCTCSATDTDGHNNHGLARTSAFPPGSIASLVRDEPLENTRKQLSHTSGDARRGEEEEVQCMVPQCSQCFSTAPTQNDVAAGAEVHLPGRNGDIMRSLFLSPEGQRTPGAKERRRSGARATKSSPDAGRSPQNTNGDTGAVSSATPMLPPASATGVLDDAGHERSGRTRARFGSHNSEADLARKELLGYEGNQPNQASCNVRPRKSGEQAVSGCSQDFTRACTRNKVDFSTKPESPENLRDITGIAFASTGAQLTSVGVRLDEIRRSDARTTRSSWEIGRRPQDAGGGPKHATSATPMTSPICTSGATDTGHTEQDQTTISYVRCGSNTCLELKGPSGYTDSSSNQASSGARRGKPEKQIVAMCSQDYATVRTRMDVAVSTTEESPGSLRHLEGDISAVSSVRLTSEGVESDGRRQNSARSTKRCLDVNRSPQDAKNDTDSTTSVTPMSPPTCTCGATNRDRMRVNISSYCLETDLGRKEPSGFAGHPFNQASKDDRQGREEEHELTRYSHDIATTCTRNNVTVATKAESPESPGNITRSPYASSRLHPALTRVGTDKQCRGDARATRSCLEVGHSAHPASGHTEATTYSTLMSPPECPCCAVDDASHTSRGRTKVSISRLGSEEDSTQEEPLGYAGNSCYQTLRNARQGKVGNFEGIRSRQDSTRSRTRKHVAAVELPRCLGNSMESPYPSPGPQLDESRRNGRRATRSNSDADQFSQDSREDAEAAMSAISTSPICAYRATKAGQSNRGRTRVISLSRDSVAYLAMEESSGYASSPSHQASSGARRGKDTKHDVIQCSQDFTPTRSSNNVAGTSKAGSQGSLCDITRISFNSPRLQLTSTGVGTDERRRSGAKTKRSSSEVGRRPQGVNDSSTAATSVTPKSSLKCACRVTDDADHTGCDRMRINSMFHRSETELAWREHSGNTSIMSCQTSSDAILGKEEQQYVSRRFRDAATARERNNSYVKANTESQRSLCDATDCTSASPGVQPTSVGVGTTVRRRDGAKSKRSSSDVTRRTQGASENTEAEICVTQASLSTCTCHASDDAGYTTRSRTRLNSSSHSLGENYTRKDHSGNTGNPSNQTSRDVRRCNEDKHEVPLYSEDSIIAHTRNDVAVETKIESPGGFGEVTWSICDSPGAQLTSAGGRMDERLCDRTHVTRRSLKAQQRLQGMIEDTGAAKYVVSISPPICTCGVTDDADYTSRDQPRENSLSRARQVNLARNDPWGYTDDRENHLASDDRRGDEEEDLLQFSKYSTPARIRKKTVTVAARTDSPVSLGDSTGSPSAFPGVRLSVEEGTNKRRWSGWEATKSSDVGPFAQGPGGDSEAATFVTPIQPSTCTCGATYDAGHNSRRRTRRISLKRDSGAYSSLGEPSRKKGIDFYRISTETGRGEEGERGVQRGSWDLTQARRFGKVHGRHRRGQGS